MKIFYFIFLYKVDLEVGSGFSDKIENERHL